MSNRAKCRFLSILSILFNSICSEVSAAMHQDQIIPVVTLHYADVICNSSNRRHKHSRVTMLDLAKICMIACMPGVTSNTKEEPI